MSRIPVGLTDNLAGEIVSKIDHPFDDNWRLLVIDRLSESSETTGRYLIAVVAVDAGIGETFLVNDE